MRTDNEALEVALRALGVEPTDELMEQFGVMVEALEIYEKRSVSYGEVWRQYGALSNLLSAARKVDRLMEVWWHNPDGALAFHKSLVDDAIDGLNYLTFFIRNARIANVAGSAPERPSNATVDLIGDDGPVNRVVRGVPPWVHREH